MTLHKEVLQFILDYAPRHLGARLLFVQRLRTLMNRYAAAALRIGTLPEKDGDEEFSSAIERMKAVDSVEETQSSESD